jgi:hypothetical protein
MKGKGKIKVITKLCMNINVAAWRHAGMQQ